MTIWMTENPIHRESPHTMDFAAAHRPALGMLPASRKWGSSTFYTIQVLVQTGPQLLLEGWMHYGPLYEGHGMMTPSPSQARKQVIWNRSGYWLTTLIFAFVALIFQVTLTDIR